MTGPVFIGLDLAWSNRHNTGGVALQWDSDSGAARLIAYPTRLGGNDEIIEWVGSVAPAKTPALLAIDAPLVVPNVSGARAGDKLISRVFGPYQAGTHPANRTNLGRYGDPPGDIRGETLAARLVAELNFEHNPYLTARSASRQLFECYPHPAMVVLFELTTTLKYKRKLRSLNNDRYAAYETLQSHLSALTTATPALERSSLLDLLDRDTRLLRGNALKHYEDTLDALMCAYIALYYWYWGPERTRVFGSLPGGYIVAPVTPALADLARKLEAEPAK